MGEVELVLLNQLPKAGLLPWQVYFEVVTLQAVEHIINDLLNVTFSGVAPKVFFVLWRHPGVNKLAKFFVLEQPSARLEKTKHFMSKHNLFPDSLDLVDLLLHFLGANHGDL